MSGDDEIRGWRWRNCRHLSIAVWFHILPWQWRIRGEIIADTYTEFWAAVQFGPIGFKLEADTGNRSAEDWRARFGLSDDEAWERSK